MSHAVLVIDDEEILAKNICRYLTRHGYEARAASSGEEGLATLDRFNPDLVLLDIQLPGLDGLDVLRRIRAMACHIKVVMMTAHGGVSVAVEAMKALDLSGRVVLVVGADDDTASRSFRDIPGVQLLKQSELNAYDILCSDWLVFTTSTLPGGES